VMGFTARESCLDFQGSAPGIKQAASYPVAHQRDRDDQHGERAAHQNTNRVSNAQVSLCKVRGASWARQHVKKAARGTGARGRPKTRSRRASSANG
jgi:hypothetical protein